MYARTLLGFLAMNYEEFQRHVGKAGLTIKAFAELLCMNRVSISNLSKKGEVPVHLGVIAALLGEMADKGVDYRAILARIKIEPRPAKGIAAKGVFGGQASKAAHSQIDQSENSA
ncbi:hypothetical protein MASR1M60_10620 [Rhodocyclaceae bacterium]